MQKIVFVGPAYPFRGGLAAFNERLSKEFIANGKEVKTYTFTLQYPEFLFPGKSQYSDGPPPQDLVIEKAVNSINPLSWIKLGLRIKNEKPDVVIMKFWIPFMGPCLGTIARLARRNKHTKVIAIIDNIIPHESRIGDKILSKYFINSCDALVAMSKSVLEDLALFNKGKPGVFCPHPLYDNFGHVIDKGEAKKILGLDERLNYLLFFGFIRAYKGLDLLIKAFADQRFRSYPLKMIVAGEYYEDDKPYIDLIEENGLREFVIQSNDYVPDEDVRNYFCAADLIVQPYKSATQSGVTQIAYHFNKPMLVTDVGGLPEMIPDGKVGYVVRPDPAEIANAILDFYENKREAQFVANAMEEKKKYSWKSMFDKIVDLHENL